MPWLKRILAVGHIRQSVISRRHPLEQEGYSVACARDAETANKMLSSLRFDLVVLAHVKNQTPGLIAEIKRQHPKTRFAVIHPYPEDQAPITNLPPKSAAIKPDKLLSELRFLFEAGKPRSQRRVG